MKRKKKTDPEITLSNCQIKDIYTLRQIAKAFHILECRTGIGPTWLTLKDVFVCPDITDKQLKTLDRTPTGKNIYRIIKQLRK